MTESQTPHPFDRHRAALQDPPIEYRPELRWWLAEGLHTDRTLRFEIDAAHRLGFGGMEFLAMDEQAIAEAMRRTKNNKAQACKLLGMNIQRLNRRIQRLGIRTAKD